MKDKLTLSNLSLPDNPTARRLLELIGEYQVRYVLFDDGAVFTAPDLSEAKGQHEKDFSNNFLPKLTGNKNNDSSTPDDVWVLERDSLKEFKDTYQDQLGISLGRINKLTVVGWNTAYHYLVQGHSETAKDFSNLGADSVAQSFEEETKDQSELLASDPIISMRLKEQRRQAEEQQRQAQYILEQAKALQSVEKTQQFHQNTLKDLLSKMAGFNQSLKSIQDAINLETDGLPQSQRRKLESIVSPLGSYLACLKVRENDLEYRQAQKEAQGEVWREISKKLRYSDHGFSLEARYQNRKREYENAVVAWKAAGATHGQKPTHLKISRPDILEQEEMLEEAIEAAKSVVFEYIQKVDS